VQGVDGAQRASARRVLTPEQVNECARMDAFTQGDRRGGTGHVCVHVRARVAVGWGGERARSRSRKREVNRSQMRPAFERYE